MKAGIQADYGFRNGWKMHFGPVLVSGLLENACWILCVISQKLKFLDCLYLEGYAG